MSCFSFKPVEYKSPLKLERGVSSSPIFILLDSFDKNTGCPCDYGTLEARAYNKVGDFLFNLHTDLQQIEDDKDPDIVHSVVYISAAGNVLADAPDCVRKGTWSLTSNYTGGSELLYSGDFLLSDPLHLLAQTPHAF